MDFYPAHGAVQTSNRWIMGNLPAKFWAPLLSCSLLLGMLPCKFQLLQQIHNCCLYSVFSMGSTSCREPAWGTPPVAKVMRKEARHTQKWDRASGVTLVILQRLPPKPESAYFTALCSHLHLCFYGGLSPTTSFGEGVNLEFQLIIIPGRDRNVSTYKLLWKFSSLPDRFVWPHVIVHSLPTVRGTRCSKLSKNRFF